MKRIIRGLSAATLAVGLMTSGVAAASALSCPAGSTCRWHDTNYSGKKATASGDNADYNYPNGQNQWDDGSWGLNDNVSSLTNHGTRCWITFYEDSAYSGAGITFGPVNGAYQWQDPYLSNGGGYRGAGHSALGGTVATSNWDNRISSHNFCS